MVWANFLHFYQPYNQQDDILDRIVHECYIPLLDGLLLRPKARTLVNISGVLIELLESRGYSEVLIKFKKLYEMGCIELTGSAKFHAFLPLLPESEIIRQIKLNEDTLSRIFNCPRPAGFFSPEMSISDKVLEIVANLGYKWISAPDVAYSGTNLRTDKFYIDARTGVHVFFRNKRISALILSGVCHSFEDFKKETGDAFEDGGYWFTVMDAETFGHHRIGHEQFLFDLLDSGELETVTYTELAEKFTQVEVVENLRPSTWTNEEQDFWLDKEKNKPTEARSFILWKDPENPIHKLQWEFVEYLLQLLSTYDNKNDAFWKAGRTMMDYAISSDQFWWASAKPWWSLEMIESGAFTLKNVVNTLNKDDKESERYYRQILSHAFEWQRTGYIRKKHLENSSTFMRQPFNERAPEEWYNQMILEFEDQMEKSAKAHDYEKAIKWRDAIYKLKLGTDIYDVLHVVDELWTARKIPSVKPFLQHKPGEFSPFVKKHFRGKLK